MLESCHSFGEILPQFRRKPDPQGWIKRRLERRELKCYKIKRRERERDFTEIRGKKKEKKKGKKKIWLIFEEGQNRKLIYFSLFLIPQN